MALQRAARSVPRRRAARRTGGKRQNVARRHSMALQRLTRRVPRRKVARRTKKQKNQRGERRT